MAKIKILGSAAAEGVPAIFCDCPTCQAARRNGGKDVRMRTAYALNERVRIDFGPDSMAQDFRYNLHSENIRHMIFTHSHEDHLDSHLLAYRYKGYSKVTPGSMLNVYGNSGVFDVLKQTLDQELENIFNGDYGKVFIRPNQVKSYCPFDIPEEDMTFYPMPADHMLNSPTEHPNIYIFRIGKAWGMIANDTGFPREDVWEYMEKQQFRLDLVIADCCYALLDSERGHMGKKANIRMKQRLTDIGCLKKNSQYFVNHFSHNGGPLQKDLEETYTPYGIQVAYDGLEIEFPL